MCPLANYASELKCGCANDPSPSLGCKMQIIFHHISQPLPHISTTNARHRELRYKSSRPWMAMVYRPLGHLEYCCSPTLHQVISGIHGIQGCLLFHVYKPGNSTVAIQPWLARIQRLLLFCARHLGEFTEAEMAAQDRSDGSSSPLELSLNHFDHLWSGDGSKPWYPCSSHQNSW